MLVSMFASSSQAVPLIANALGATTLPRHAVLAIDGRTGSGKTTLAGQLAKELAPKYSVCRVEVERHIEGWAGLASGLRDLARGPIPQFRAAGACELPVWDWHADAWGQAERVPAHGIASVMLLVGCGASSRALAPLLDGSIWLDAPKELRKQRVTSREGSPDSWWEMWETQHTELLEQWDSASHATWRVSELSGS